jgi:hypothetical protein
MVLYVFSSCTQQQQQQQQHQHQQQPQDHVMQPISYEAFQWYGTYRSTFFAFFVPSHASGNLYSQLPTTTHSVK